MVKAITNFDAGNVIPSHSTSSTTERLPEVSPVENTAQPLSPEQRVELHAFKKKNKVRIGLDPLAVRLRRLLRSPHITPDQLNRMLAIATERPIGASSIKTDLKTSNQAATKTLYVTVSKEQEEKFASANPSNKLLLINQCINSGSTTKSYRTDDNRAILKMLKELALKNNLSTLAGVINAYIALGELDLALSVIDKMMLPTKAFRVINGRTREVAGDDYPARRTAADCLKFFPVITDQVLKTKLLSVAKKIATDRKQYIEDPELRQFEKENNRNLRKTINSALKRILELRSTH